MNLPKWIKLALFLGIVAVFILTAFPWGSGINPRTKMTRAMAHTDQIIKGCKLYALDHDGIYPSDTEKRTIQTSTEAFQILSDYLDLGVEGIFWTAGNPEKLRPPNEDGELISSEVSFIYVKGQGEQTDARSPLVADEMTSPSVYGKNHPFLSERRAIVGYCGGQVKQERLTSRKSGAVIRGPIGSGIDNIFLPGEWDEEGNHLSGGYLAVPLENVLFPQ